MASSARRDVRHLPLWTVALAAVWVLSAAGPAARAQVIQVNPTPTAESGQRSASGDPFAGPTQKTVSTPPTIEHPGRRVNDCSAQSEIKIRTALHDPTTMEFTETPLQDAVDYLKELHHIAIQFDTKALAEAGISSDTPVTRSLKDISLDSALKLVLNDLDLTTVVTNGVLLITTHEAANQIFEVRIYEVADLVGVGADTEKLAQALRTLLTTNPNGGMSSAVQIVPFQKLLLVRAPVPYHEELGRVLPDIRDKLKSAK